MTGSYEDFLPAQRLGSSLAVSADGTLIAYISDATGQLNLWTQPTDGGAARQLTSFTDHAVRQVAWAPDGRMVAFTADQHGDEQYQVYLIPTEGGEPTLVSKGTGQHFLAEEESFDARQRHVFYGGQADDPALPAVIACDLASRTETRWPGIPQAFGFAVAISPDGSYVLGGGMMSNTKCQGYVAPVAEPGTDLRPATGSLPGEFYLPGPWTADSSGFYVLTTDGDRDHVSLGRFCLNDSTLTIVDSPSWDVEDIAASADGRTVVWCVNEDGYSVLRGQRDGARLDIPPVPGGAIKDMRISADGTVLALLLETPDRPASAALLNLDSDRSVRYITDTRPAAARNREPLPPELIRYPAGDGTPIPAWLYRPTGPGPHPVLVSVHGGPERQARPDYDPLHQCLLARGIAVLAPNIRGSSGYGHSWQTRIYRDWGGIDLDDLAAAHAWLSAQTWADPSKLAVYGMSYGGFASLSCMTRRPDLWAAGVSVCGPANLDTLARSMPPDWAATIAANFGDPDNPADAEQLRSRSPVTYAGQIAAPLLVVQGANDPRVPRAESDQIIEAARANRADARYLVFDDEGHGFTSRENDIKANQAVVDFLTEQLLP